MVALAAAAGCGGQSAGAKGAPATHAIAGTVAVGRGPADSNGGCRASSHNPDITSGTTVTVKNDHGTVVGTGHLGDGTPSPSSQYMCDFTFDVTVTDSPFYVVAVAQHENTVSRSDLAAKGWHLDIGLGL